MSQGHKQAPLVLRILARLGYTARGTIYLIIGGLALLHSVGQGGESTDSKGAIKELLGAPFGVFLVWALFGGLLGYSIWRFVQSVFNPDELDRDLKGYTVRGALMLSSLTHAALAYYAYSLVSKFGGGGGGGSAHSSIVSKLLELPGGSILVAVLGLGIATVGLAHFYRAYKKSYEDHFDIGRLPMSRLSPFCQGGLVARGIVFILIGILFVTAGFKENPSKAGGLESAMESLQSQSFGNFLLGTLSAGLLLFAVYCFTEAIARKIQSPTQ